jgi:hypothetical protein
VAKKMKEGEINSLARKLLRRSNYPARVTTALDATSERESVRGEQRARSLPTSNRWIVHPP